MAEDKEYYKNGNLKKEYIYLENDKSKTIEYYSNGNLKSITLYKDFLRDGRFQEYYSNGNPKEDCIYKNGELDGECKTYYIDGQLEIDCSYLNNELNGLYKTYYQNGILNQSINFKNDKPLGDFYTYYESGELYSKAFLTEEKINTILEYDKNGFVIRVITLIKTPQGSKKKVKKYKNGEYEKLEQKLKEKETRNIQASEEYSFNL